MEFHVRGWLHFPLDVPQINLMVVPWPCYTTIYPWGHPTELEGVLFVVDAHTIAILTGVAIARSGLCMAICSLNSSTGGGRSSSIALLAFMASHSYQELNLRNEIPPNNTNETTKFPWLISLHAWFLYKWSSVTRGCGCNIFYTFPDKYKIPFDFEGKNELVFPIQFLCFQGGWL